MVTEAVEVGEMNGKSKMPVTGMAKVTSGRAAGAATPTDGIDALVSDKIAPTVRPAASARCCALARASAIRPGNASSANLRAVASVVANDVRANAAVTFGVTLPFQELSSE